MTSPILLRLPVRSRRDTLRARILARRLAGLLRLETREAILFATGVFVLVSRLVQHRWQAVLEFRRDAGHLRAGLVPLLDGPAAPEDFPDSFVRGEIVRPVGDDVPLAEADLAWMAHWIGERFPVDAFEEMLVIHRELLFLAERPTLHDDRPAQEGEDTTSAA